MLKKTDKQKRQEEEYKKVMAGKRISTHDSEDLFGLGSNHTRHVNKICSVCGHHWAWYSADNGSSWQCSEHKINS